METFQAPRILISGTATGVGKSLLTMGIAYALRKRNISSSYCVVGPRLAQAAILRRISGRYVRCLDSALLTPEQITLSLRHAMLGAEMIVMDGRFGLYDSEKPGSLDGSDAKIAILTGSPVALVVDVRGFGSSLSALVKGYTEAADDFEIHAAILNHVEVGSAALPGPRGAAFFKDCLAASHLPPVIGAIPYSRLQAILPPPQVSQARNTTILPHQFFLDVERLIANSVDIEKIIEIAGQAPLLRLPGDNEEPAFRKCRIAVSDDSCFSAGFQDNLDLLRYFGAELVPFSPLADECVPANVGAVYLTGGYILEYLDGLAANRAMRQSLADFYAAGGVIFAEGAGAAYLCESITAKEAAAVEGVGLLPAGAVQDARGGSYLEASTSADSLLGPQGIRLKGMDSGEWRLSEPSGLGALMRVKRSDGKELLSGYTGQRNLFASFDFLHFGSNPEAAKNLIAAARRGVNTA